MRRERQKSKEELDKLPEWNNDWHKDDDIEVLVKGESPPRQGTSQGRTSGKPKAYSGKQGAIKLSGR